MIRRILFLKFVSWVVLAPVLALAPTHHKSVSHVRPRCHVEKCSPLMPLRSC